MGLEWFWPHRNAHQTVSWTANGTPFYLMGAHVQQELPAAAEHARALALDPEHHEAFEALARLRTAAGD